MTVTQGIFIEHLVGTGHCNVMGISLQHAIFPENMLLLGSKRQSDPLQNQTISLFLHKLELRLCYVPKSFRFGDSQRLVGHLDHQEILLKGIYKKRLALPQDR